MLGKGPSLSPDRAGAGKLPQASPGLCLSVVWHLSASLIFLPFPPEDWTRTTLLA